jgi:hypothetical protein
MAIDGEGGLDLDTTVAHPARVYDYWLGGTDNFAADREAGELALEAYPQLAEAVKSNRAFLARAVRFLTGEAGVRQFLDLGTGIPSANNTHQVAQREVPDSRIVYVDSDPIVLKHAQALLSGSPDGACDYLHADLRDSEAVLAAAERTLDFGAPVALMLLAVLQFIGDDEDPYGLCRGCWRRCRRAATWWCRIRPMTSIRTGASRSTATTSASPTRRCCGTGRERPGSLTGLS